MSVHRMYIGGKWTPAQGGATRDIIDPATGDVLASVAEGDVADARAAITVARRAFDGSEWPHLPAGQRATKLFKLADLIEQDKENLARLETLNTGKTLAESRQDMSDIANVFRYYAGLAGKHAGQVVETPTGNLSMVVREPAGVAGQICPWNYPLLQASWKIAPALAAGNTLVCKPSEITPLTTIRLAELVQELELPPGVFNVVLGSGATVGQELAGSPLVDIVSFTGGGVTGRKIMQAAAGNLKRVALELGGKNPNIIFADAGLDVALDYALNAVFFHCGQVCSAGSRLLLQESIHDAFVARLVERVRKIRIGNGLDSDTQMGPLISEQHRAKVERYIRLAQEEGCTLVCGGGRPQGARYERGFFVEPTVFTGARPHMRVVQEEIFGPVITVESFRDEEEAVRLANDTVYGLSGAVWTRDIQKGHRVAGRLRMGTVWVNDYNVYFPEAPWGGYKQSGIGRELGSVGLEEYQQVKHVYVSLNSQAINWFGA